MNAILIPFFLVANIPVTEKWTYGPEYIFHANVSNQLTVDHIDEPFYTANLTAVLKCRPKSNDSLYCALYDVMMNSERSETPEKTNFDHPFLIKFNRRGIESITFPEHKGAFPFNSEKLNIIRTIINELSVGLDVQHDANTYHLPAYAITYTENILGKCASLFLVTQIEAPPSAASEEPAEKPSYTLDLLPEVTARKPESIFVVEKRTEHSTCNKAENHFYPKEGVDVLAGKSFSMLQMTSNGMFKSKTEMQVHVGTPPGPMNTVLQDTSCVELKDIVPATEEIPTVSFDETVTLRLTDMKEHNFIF